MAAIAGVVFEVSPRAPVPTGAYTDAVTVSLTESQAMKTVAGGNRRASTADISDRRGIRGLSANVPIG